MTNFAGTMRAPNANIEVADDICDEQVTSGTDAGAAFIDQRPDGLGNTTALLLGR